MNITSVLAEKKEKASILKKDLWILLKYKPLWLINISDPVLSWKLIDWLKNLDAWFVIYNKDVKNEKISNNIATVWKIDNNLLSSFDFIICDDNISNIENYTKKWITPIIIKNNHFSSILNEFNPLKNEWNSFFYDKVNKWSIFYSLVRYLENYKFSFDNKNLVKNVLDI